MAEKKIKILLVDDNEVVRLFFKDLFWLHGLETKFEVQVADGIESAEKLVRNIETRPDVIFLDMVMPMNVDGKTITSAETGCIFLEKIKKDKELKKIKVIVFSAYDDDEHKSRAMKLGADMFLSKTENLPQDLIKFIGQMNKKLNLAPIK